MKIYKILRITTIPVSFSTLLKGQMKFMKENGFSVLMCSSAGKEISEIKENECCDHTIVPLSRKINPILDLYALIKLIMIIKKFKPDIVHTHTPKAGLLGILASWLCRIPVRLHTVAGMPLMETNAMGKKLLIFLERILYKMATNIYPNSIGLEKYILDNICKDKTKIKVLGNGSSNGIDLDYFQKSDDIIRKTKKLKIEYNILETDFVFLFVGRVVKDKGLNELIYSFNELSIKYEDVKLLIVGPFENDLNPISKISLETMSINRNIIYAGFIKDVRPFYLLSNVFVFPSYREGFPNVLLQAGAMNLPSIVSDINGSNEIIKHGFNGIIIPPKSSDQLYDAMEEIYTNKAILNSLKSNFRKTIEEKFDTKILWNLILAEYKYHLGIV